MLIGTCTLHFSTVAYRNISNATFFTIYSNKSIHLNKTKKNKKNTCHRLHSHVLIIKTNITADRLAKLAKRWTTVREVEGSGKIMLAVCSTSASV